MRWRDETPLFLKAKPRVPNRPLASNKDEKAACPSGHAEGGGGESPRGGFLFAKYCYSDSMTLHEIAKTLMHDGKGIFIADEYPESLRELFSSENISNDADALRAYREMLLSAEGIELFLSGVVLSEEASAQCASDGTPFYELLSAKAILVGALLETDGQKDLKQHAHELRSLAVSFAYVRLEINADDAPASERLKEMIRSAIESSKILQSENILPVIGIDLSTKGPHTAGQAEDTLVETLALLSDALESSGLDLKGLVVATGMPATGLDNPLRAGSNEVADRAVRAVTSSLPETLGGVAFLSGQDAPEKTAANLNAIARLEPFSWPITFAFSRAFHLPALLAWKGNEENIPNAQSAFLSRLSLTESADAAGYAPGMEDSGLM